MKKMKNSLNITFFRATAADQRVCVRMYVCSCVRMCVCVVVVAAVRVVPEPRVAVVVASLHHSCLVTTVP